MTASRCPLCQQDPTTVAPRALAVALVVAAIAICIAIVLALALDESRRQTDGLRQQIRADEAGRRDHAGQLASRDRQLVEAARRREELTAECADLQDRLTSERADAQAALDRQFMEFAEDYPTTEPWTRGATLMDVFRAQGRPTRVDGDTVYFGEAEVTFATGEDGSFRVTRWVNRGRVLKVR